MPSLSTQLLFPPAPFLEFRSRRHDAGGATALLPPAPGALRGDRRESRELSAPDRTAAAAAPGRGHRAAPGAGTRWEGFRRGDWQENLEKGIFNEINQE